ncbi:hypothetical protein PVT68_09165 [Microbulbifer bruguierae]|uniref:Peptidase M50 n=1 Tax=Microbulbifer bruguierae TaxID=3029061 RepID=A0ABY8NHP7_9GAMM|nr:hypothetical protein [Microbulbifer bruguierae]WGL18451.1 hypothetical protein PVT68_09165 [Microbulbifer bruguierae]
MQSTPYANQPFIAAPPAHAAGTGPTSPPRTGWPKLRSDLRFHRLAEDDGETGWMLYDPLRGQYLELGELELLVLHHWHQGSAEKIARSIAAEQGCRLEPSQVEAVAGFVRDNELLQSESLPLLQKLAAISPQQQRLQKLQRTLFWRRPLFTPELSSRLLLPLARASQSPWFYALLLAAAIFSAISIGQHSGEFFAYFDASWNAAGALVFFLCYLILSLFHELGHASVARLYGVRANSVGVGLIAMMPIMFSEITDAWRLPRKARLHISAAGVLFEAAIGAAAATTWCLLDDGPLRALMFYLFTTSLVSTLLINANPLMKFDGYYLLSDFTGEKNLHQGASTTLRHWLWVQLLRGPKPAISRRQKLLVLFGLTSLIYRTSVFALISYGAYQLLFKAAGILILVLCLFLLLVLPAVREARAFIAFVKEQNEQKVQKEQPQSQAMTSQNTDNGTPPTQPSRSDFFAFVQLLNPKFIFAFSALLAVLLIPLPWPVQLPASTYFSAQQQVKSPAGAVLEKLALEPGGTVVSGSVIAQLRDTELDYRIARTQQELGMLNRRQQSDGFAESLDALDGVYLQDLLSKRQLLHALLTEKKQLEIVAKVAGTVDWVSPGLHEGQYLEVNQPFLSIARRDSLAGRAYGKAQQLARLQQNSGQPLRGKLFVQGQWLPLAATVHSAEQIASRRIQDPALASAYGGPLQTVADEPERAAEALHILSFTFDADARATLNSAQRSGYLVLLGKPTSLLSLAVDRVAGVLIRESGV